MIDSFVYVELRTSKWDLRALECVEKEICRKEERVQICTVKQWPWDFPGKSIGEGCHFLLHGIFPTQGSNLSLPHCRQTLYHLSHQASPCKAVHSNLKNGVTIAQTMWGLNEWTGVNASNSAGHPQPSHPCSPWLLPSFLGYIALPGSLVSFFIPHERLILVILSQSWLLLQAWGEAVDHRGERPNTPRP